MTPVSDRENFAMNQLIDSLDGKPKLHQLGGGQSVINAKLYSQTEREVMEARRHGAVANDVVGISQPLADSVLHRDNYTSP